MPRRFGLPACPQHLIHQVLVIASHPHNIHASPFRRWAGGGLGCIFPTNDGSWDHFLLRLCLRSTHPDNTRPTPIAVVAQRCVGASRRHAARLNPKRINSCLVERGAARTHHARTSLSWELVDGQLNKGGFKRSAFA
jgi:hypothetical protein